MIIYDIEIEKAILKGREIERPDIQYCKGFSDFSATLIIKALNNKVSERDFISFRNESK